LIEVDIPMVDTVTRSAHVDRKLDRMVRLKFGLPLTRAGPENAFMQFSDLTRSPFFHIYEKRHIFLNIWNDFYLRGG
jgi:hypothetical protein